MAAPPVAADLISAPVRELLDALADDERTPAAGAAAAVTASMAAALVAKCARASDDWVEAPGIAAQAQALRARLVALVATAVEAYEGALDALREGDARPEWRDYQLGRALVRAADAPLAIADAAADIAELAAESARNGDAARRPDAIAAAMLADAAVRSCAALVAANLAAGAFQERTERAARAEDVASRALRRAVSEPS